MPRHASNSERIANAAAEADARAKEKAAKPPAAPRVRKGRTPKAPPRMKIVWGVGPAGGAVAKTFPYPERAAADAEAARKSWIVTTQRVLMVDEPPPVV